MAGTQMNPVQWHQAQDYARQYCGRVFCEGGSPEDALEAFGLTSEGAQAADWSDAVSLIAGALCQQPSRRAA